MKLILSAAFLVSMLALLRADDLTTRDGKVYKNYKVIAHDSGFITILDEDGGGQIPLSNLPDAMQKQYGYDPTAAAAAVKASEAAYRADAAKLAAEEQQAAKLKEQRDAALYSTPTATGAPGAPPSAAGTTVAAPPINVVAVEGAINDDQQKLDGLQSDLAAAQHDYNRDHNPVTGAQLGHTDRSGVWHPMYSGTASADHLQDVRNEINDMNNEIAQLKQQLAQANNQSVATH